MTPNILLLKDNSGLTVEQYIRQNRIKFGHSERQHLIGYINRHYDNTERRRIIKDLLSYSERFSLNEIDEYANLVFRFKDYDLIRELKRYGIEIKGNEVKFTTEITEKHKLNKNDIKIPHLINSAALIEKYPGYKPEFIMEPHVFKNGVNLIGAERGTGKTRFCVSLACCLVYELPIFLGFPIKSHGNVLYLNFEMKEPEFKLILEPIINYYHKSHEKKHNFSIVNYLNDPVTCLDLIEDYITENLPILVIIDSFKMFMSALAGKHSLKIIDNQTILIVYDQLNKWRDKHQTTFLITNHTNKGTKGQRSHSDLMFGPSSLSDYADHTCLLRKTEEPNLRLIVPDKCRFMSEGSYGVNLIEIVSDPDDGTLNFELIEKEVNEADYMYKPEQKKQYDEATKQKALELHSQGKTCREIEAETNVNYSTVSRWIKKNFNLN